MHFLAIAALVGATIASPLTQKRADTHNGVATYFYQGGNAGSCGDYHGDGDYIVAISQDYPFSYNEFCGRTVTIKNVGGGDNNYGVGNEITATVADTCPGCDENHLDLSTGAFEALTGGQLDPPGQFSIEWSLN